MRPGGNERAHFCQCCVCVCSQELQQGLKPENPIPHHFPIPLSLTGDREYKKELTVCWQQTEKALLCLHWFPSLSPRLWDDTCSIILQKCRAGAPWFAASCPEVGLSVESLPPGRVGAQQQGSLKAWCNKYKIRQNLKIICWAGFDVASDHWHANAFL